MEPGKNAGNKRKGIALVMNYSAIKNFDIANGLGIRVSLFVSGCTHRCKGCFNSEAWDFEAGKEFSKEVEDKIIGFLSDPNINGLSLLGGEPMELQNQSGLVDFLKRVKKTYPQKSIWCYTGYTYDKDLIPGGKVYGQVTDEILSLIDVLVDGEFVEEFYSVKLKFRGSSNQRIIDLKKTRESNNIVLYME